MYCVIVSMSSLLPHGNSFIKISLDPGSFCRKAKRSIKLFSGRRVGGGRLVITKISCLKKMEVRNSFERKQ